LIGSLLQYNLVDTAVMIPAQKLYFISGTVSLWSAEKITINEFVLIFGFPYQITSVSYLKKSDFLL